MFKKINAAILTLTLGLFLSACGDNDQKLKGAFGIEFGSDIEDVRYEISKLGDFEDDGFIIKTKYIKESNPYFDNYRLEYYGSVYSISAITTLDLSDKDAAELFARLEGELTKKYGQPKQKLSSEQLPKGNEIITKQENKWLVGKDTIELSHSSFVDQDNANYIDVVYYSINTRNLLEEKYLSDQAEEKQSKENSTLKGL